MKDEKFDSLVAVISKSNLFRNDGHGHLFFYDAARGIWCRQSAVDARRNLAKVLKELQISLRRDELTPVYKEIAENIDFVEPQLASDIPSSLVAVRNGVINLETGKLEKHSPTLFLRYSLDFEYLESCKKMPEANPWVHFAKTSLGVATKEIETCPVWISFLETVFYPLTNLQNAKKMVIFVGPPNSGKSVVLRMMGEVIGADSFVALSFSDMLQRFRGSLMEGRRVVLSHEMPLKPIRGLDVLKKIISGDPIIIEEKCQNAKQYVPRINLVFAANNMPNLAEPDAGGAFADRLLILPFQKVEKIDRSLYSKLWEERDAFLTLAAKSMASFIQRGFAFTECEQGAKILESFRNDSFSLAHYIATRYQRKMDSKICLSDFYEDYIAYCSDEAISAISKTELKAALFQMNLRCDRVRISGYPNARSCLIGLERIPPSDAT